MANRLTADDPRYARMFNVTAEAMDPDAGQPEIQGGLHQRGMTNVNVRLRPKASA